jgi:hypothetical protein
MTDIDSIFSTFGQGASILLTLLPLITCATCPTKYAGNVDDDDWGSNVPAPTDAVPKPDPVQPVAAVLKPGSSDAALPAVAAVLKPEYTAALDRHNLYRQQHQVGC